MNPCKEVNLIVLDEPSNFHSEQTQNRTGGKDLFKTVQLIQNLSDFETVLSNLQSLDKLVLVCHVFHAHDDGKVQLRGYYNLLNSTIEDKYNIKALLVSSGDSGEVMKTVYNITRERLHVYQFSDIRTEINEGRCKVFTKIEVLQKPNAGIATNKLLDDPDGGSNISYAIIAALYEEFEEVAKHFEWIKEHEIRTLKKIYRIGHLRNRPEKKIVAAVPSSTGMVDAAIIATQMLELFKPKYLLMSGVCGGKPNLKFGSIVVANKVFQFQKGKISDIVLEKGKKIELFDTNKNKIDYEHLYDENGNQIVVRVEKFEIEHDSIIPIHSLVKDQLEPELKRIEDAINQPYSDEDKISIVLEPIACSTMVIDKEDYFKEIIKPIDRKTVAVEMESYGVARACEFANNGKTKFIIFKSVMDHMSNKGDSKKRLAAYTSAQFLKHLLYDDVI